MVEIDLISVWGINSLQTNERGSGFQISPKSYVRFSWSTSHSSQALSRTHQKNRSTSCSVSCYPAVAAAAVLLLATTVRHRVPDDAICCCGLLHLIPVFYFSSFKHDLSLMYRLAVLSHVQPRFTYNLTIHIIYPRKLWACAEPRRAAARRGGAPLEQYNNI